EEHTPWWVELDQQRLRAVGFALGDRVLEIVGRGGIDRADDLHQVHVRGARGQRGRTEQEPGHRSQAAAAQRHSRAPSIFATRSSRRSATSSLPSGGSDSTSPPGQTKLTVLRSASKPESGAETSLATSRSQPLRAILRCAAGITSSLSAAKPTITREPFSRHSSARLSGLRTSSSAIPAPSARSSLRILL